MVSMGLAHWAAMVPKMAAVISSMHLAAAGGSLGKEDIWESRNHVSDLKA